MKLRHLGEENDSLKTFGGETYIMKKGSGRVGCCAMEWKKEEFCCRLHSFIMAALLLMLSPALKEFFVDQDNVWILFNIMLLNLRWRQVGEQLCLQMIIHILLSSGSIVIVVVVVVSWGWRYWCCCCIRDYWRALSGRL